MHKDWQVCQSVCTTQKPARCISNFWISIWMTSCLPNVWFPSGKVIPPYRSLSTPHICNTSALIPSYYKAPAFKSLEDEGQTNWCQRYKTLSSLSASHNMIDSSCLRVWSWDNLVFSSNKDWSWNPRPSRWISQTYFIRSLVDITHLSQKSQKLIGFQECCYP